MPMMLFYQRFLTLFTGWKGRIEIKFLIERDKLIITVEDNGEGVLSYVKDRLFKERPVTTKQKYIGFRGSKGKGLFLAQEKARLIL